MVQGAQLQQGERLGEVDVLPDRLVVQDLPGFEDVGRDEMGAIVFLEQRAAVREYHRVVVDVDDLCVRVDALYDLVGVFRGRQA